MDLAVSKGASPFGTKKQICQFQSIAADYTLSVTSAEANTFLQAALVLLLVCLHFFDPGAEQTPSINA